MQWLETLIIVSHVVVAVGLVGIILMQRGKGADMGAAFGGGASQTVFGSQGSGSFMTKITSILAIVFFVTSFSLAVFAKQRAEVAQFEGIPTVEEIAPPAQQDASEDTGSMSGDAENTDVENAGVESAESSAESEPQPGAAEGEQNEQNNSAGAEENTLPELQ